MSLGIHQSPHFPGKRSPFLSEAITCLSSQEGLGPGIFFSIYAGMLAGFGWLDYYTGNHSCCEFICPTALSNAEDSISGHSSTSGTSSQCSLGIGGGRVDLAGCPVYVT